MSNEKQPTHVAVRSNAKAPVQIDQLKVVMQRDYSKQVQNYFGGNKDEALRFMTAAIDYVRRVPKLLECDQTSLMIAFVQSAQFRFMPSGVGGEAYIIPYGREAKFQLGYQGVVTLLYRTERISTITANIIYQNDEFDYQEGLETKLAHKPAMFGKPKGDPIGVYVVATMRDGTKTFKVMDKDAVLSIKNLSKAKNTADSPWNSDKDPEKWMWKKTCLLQLAKLLPKTPDLQQAIEKDFEGEGIERMHVDAAGPGVPSASHRPEVEEGKVKEKPPVTIPKNIDDDIPIIEEGNYPGPKDN